MGIVCCGGRNNFLELEIKQNPKFYLKNRIKSLTELVTLLQSYYRRHLSIKKYKTQIENLKEEIFSQLDKKKLINNEIISECISEKIYQDYLLNGKIKSYMEIVNSNKKIKSNLLLLGKYSFFIPNYIVASPNEVYKGSWNLNKKYHGYGVKYEFNTVKNTDSRTEGTFNNGLLFGFGRIILSNGDIFIGRYLFGKMTGIGEYRRKDGSKYEGEFSEGIPHGKGKEKLCDGTTFEGIYFGGMRKKGKIIWKDGSSYEGFFENDKPDDFGKYNWGNKRHYEGEWKDGKMNGKGKFTYPNGSYYEGEFINGKKNGKGKYVWEKNTVYIGEWKDDKQNGKGILIKNGKEISGFWANGHLFSKTVGANNKNIFRKVRKRPTIGGYSLNNQKSKYLNMSCEKISSCRTNLKSEENFYITKNHNAVKSEISNTSNIQENDYLEPNPFLSNELKVNIHKHTKTNGI